MAGMGSCSKTWSQHSTKTGVTKIGNPRPRFGVSGKKGGFTKRDGHLRMKMMGFPSSEGGAEKRGSLWRRQRIDKELVQERALSVEQSCQKNQ